MTSSVEQHRLEVPASVRCMIITVSDTRTVETDMSGQLIEQLLMGGGYEMVREKRQQA
jgi:molybdenum cofactor biosynthesis protein B